MAASLEMFTTRPCELSRRGNASCTRARGARTFTSRTLRRFSREVSARGGSGDVPSSDALFTSTSIRPAQVRGAWGRGRGGGGSVRPPDVWLARVELALDALDNPIAHVGAHVALISRYRCW